MDTTSPKTDCTNYIEDPCICDSQGDPKGQCANCGWKWHEHAPSVLATADAAAEVRHHEAAIASLKIIIVTVTPRRVTAISPGSIGGSHYLHAVSPQQAAQEEALRRGWRGTIVPAEMPEYTLPGRGVMHAFVLVP